MGWEKSCYSRLLIDNHITDEKPEFMGCFSPQEYVRLVELAGVESSMVYACDHNGNCYYPTKVGHFHKGLNGRDGFGETVRELRRRGISPVAYYTATYHNDCAKRIPSARTVDQHGNDHGGRYYYTCPNHKEAREFYKQELAEVISYDIDGLFIDMSFWPVVCLCDECRRRFGRPIPEIIDWKDENWVAFQRFREESIADFAKELTDFVRSIKPGLTVVHQFSPVLHGWKMGQSNGIADASDYASGDFYGGKLQQRFAVKVFDAFSNIKPFEFMTSRCVNLRDHTSTKSDEELLLSALTTLASGGAYFFIDAINPNGTLHEPFYRRLAGINAELTPFRRSVQSRQANLAAEVGLYFSMANGFNRHAKPIPLKDLDKGGADNMAIASHPVLNEVLGTSEILTRMHMPYRIVTGGRKANLEGLKAIIINNAAYMTLQECEEIRKFVREGGTLIATGETSLLQPAGSGNGNFQLADVFGFDFTGEYSPSVNYTGDELISAMSCAPYVKPRPGVEIKAYLSIPDFPINDSEHYASIHSNPPGQRTNYPAIAIHNYGNGRCLWIAAPFMSLRQETQREFATRLFNEYLPQFLIASENIAASAELTLLSGANGEKIICIVNNQDEKPVIPLRDLSFTIKCKSRPVSVIKASDGMAADYSFAEDELTIRLDTLCYAEFIIIQEQCNG